MKRLAALFLLRGWVVVAAVAVSAVAAPSGDSALFFLFSPTSARPGDQIVVRTGGTPADFKVGERVRPFQLPIRVYLVANAVAEDVHSRDDPRLIAVGSLIPDKNGNGVLSFRVPELPDGSYAAAAWCPACARFSSGRTFFTLPVGDDIAPRYRSVMVLRVETDGSPLGWPSVVGLAAAIVAAVIGAAFVLNRRSHSRANQRRNAANLSWVFSGTHMHPDAHVVRPDSSTFKGLAGYRVSNCGFRPFGG